MANQVIPATARPRAGKGAARSVRREGKVPAVIYGEGKAPISIAVDANELGKTIAKGKFLARLFEIDVEGVKTRVIPRDVQRDPVKDHAVHVDFLRVGPGARIRVFVPCRFTNEAASPGLKRGGVLNVVRHEVEVFCPAETIPNEFVFDLTGLEIGRSMHISATKLPEGVKTVIQGRDFTVATIAGAVAEEEKAATTTTDAAAAPAADAKAAPAGDAKAAPAAKDAKAAPAKDAKPAAGKK
jgi:large subunit ribosomal protein L25